MNSGIAKLDKEAAIAFFADASDMIARGRKEDAIRYLFCTKLPMMFPDNPWWITAHATLAEANSSFKIEERVKKGFVDVLIGKTAVEYEKDLTKKSVFEDGYRQVEEYCAGLLNEGASPNDIIGVLSDTVRWYSYDVSVTVDPLTVEHYGPSDISLTQRNQLDMTDTSDENLKRFERFINGAFGRLGSRRLSAGSLAQDFGVQSSGGAEYVQRLHSLVLKSFSENPAYANLIQGLWDGFVNSAQKDEDRDFAQDYTHELYLVTLAKLVCANVLNPNDVDMRKDFVRSVLNGSFFQNLGIENFIEYDYFGWLNNGTHLSELTSTAIKIQEALAAYDFRDVDSEDFFGSLLTQMATADKRLLLGQAPTPPWVASNIVDNYLDNYLTESPRILDMCCGSGVFIVEVLKRYIPQKEDPEYARLISCAYDAVSGIDIDPLAVILSKANWLMLMRDHIDSFKSGLHIPIYHADSMFAATPVSRNDEASNEDRFKLKLDDQLVEIPALLFEPEYRTTLNTIIDKCDALAIEIASSNGEFSVDKAKLVVDTFVEPAHPGLSQDKTVAIERALLDLGEALVHLQQNNRNGIWPFILGNGFMPSLMKGQYNGIISNPPWLTLSKLSDNPYKDILGKKAELLGIKPEGSSFLHTELATVFFVGAINRYLEPGGTAACIMPQSILSGRHEEAFRKDRFLQAKNRTEIDIREIWELPKSTFKNRAAVLFATKQPPAQPYEYRLIPGAIFNEKYNYEVVEFSLRTNGTASAYSSSGAELEEGCTKLPFEQGFDAFPRTTLFYDAKRQPNGAWSLCSIPKQGSPLSFVTSDAKKASTFQIQPTSNVDDCLIYATLLSKQVLPFLLPDPLHLFLPIEFSDGEVRKISKTKLATLSTSTTNLIAQILECKDKGKRVFKDYQDFIEKIDYRRKLSKSLDDESRYQVVYGASGENLAATIIDLRAIDQGTPFCADQTLYWLGCNDADEAYFYMGMLNSKALNEAIKDFQPEGNFGKRHIHKLPLMFIPEYDSENKQHNMIAFSSMRVFQDVASLVKENKEARELANPSRGSLASRRTKFRSLVFELASYSDLERACKSIL